VLEPKDEKNVAYKDWSKLGSEISELGLWDDDEQPLPTNVMYPGGSLTGSLTAAGSRGCFARGFTQHIGDGQAGL
jgi:hypothetical protein